MMLPSLSQALVCVAVGVGGGAAVGSANYALESCFFHGLLGLERAGYARRLSKVTDRQFSAHPASNFWAVALPYMPLYALAALCSLGPAGFLSRMDVDLDPVRVWTFVWGAMVAHDAWFYLAHSAMHAHKAIYRHVHQQHHTNGSNISTLGSSYGDLADIALSFVSFHFVIFLALLRQERWNLPSMALLIVFESMTNLAGHAGYQLPVWLHAFFTGGVGLTPYAATTRTHFIHHIDARLNRALYFTWWDRLFGTFADEHSQVVKNEGIAEVWLPWQRLGRGLSSA